MPELPISANPVVHSYHYSLRDDRAASSPQMSALVIECTADLDMSTVDGFRRAYQDLVDEGIADGLATGDLIVLDASRVDFVSIDATSALIEAKDLAKFRGIDFKLVATTRGVEHALMATGTRKLFACYPTVDSATRSDRVEEMSLRTQRHTPSPEEISPNPLLQ